MQKPRVRQRKNNRHMTGEELLHKATGGWKFKTDNKLRGAFAETDFNKKVVRVNKKRHAQKKYGYPDGQRTPAGRESLLNTIEHELGHIRDPKATEKQVSKRAKVRIKKMSTRAKQKTYGLLNK